MMKMKLVETNENYTVYDLEHYLLREERCSYNARGFKLTFTARGNYTPDIYDVTENDEMNVNLKIGTTTYGLLDTEIIDVVIKSYQKAVDIVKFIETVYREALENTI